MPVPQKPPLNGRNLAEFYLSSETVKRTTLIAYARPVEEQQARILMYDPIRRIVHEYFASGRSSAVLGRCADTLARKQFDNPSFDEKWHKSNKSALAHLRNLSVPGTFCDTRVARLSIAADKVTVFSTVDFYGRFVPSAANSKERSVGVIVNPSGIKKRLPDQRKLWAQIESEVAFRAADAHGIVIEEVIYIDLMRSELQRFKGPRKRLWAEIVATCERIYRDWRDIRLKREGFGRETG
jgi:hypothetical protein